MLCIGPRGSKMTKRVIVTGGCGFVGSNLVDKLVELDYEVIVIDDLRDGKKEYCNPKANYIFEDFRQIFKNRKDESIDVIFHLAASARIQPSFEWPLYTCENNMYGTTIVAEFARQSDAKVVYAGSSSVYNDTHASPYTFSKWQGEEVLTMYSKIYDLDTAIVRFFNVYGPRNPVIGQYTPVIAIFEEQMKEGKPMTVVGDGEQRRDFTHIYDICSGLIAVSEGSWSAEMFNIGTGTNFSMNEITDMFGGEKEYIPERRNEAKETLADNSKARDLLGWEPKHNLPDYIKEFLDKLEK